MIEPTLLHASDATGSQLCLLTWSTWQTRTWPFQSVPL